MKTKLRKVAIYSRKSKFTGKGESIGNQIELCQEYVKLHYPDVKKRDIVVYEDEGFSGKNLDRPDFKSMMKEAREHRLDAIVVYRLDRISRNIGDFAALIEELGRLDVAFISIREQFDTESPMGRAMMYIASVFSQLERETIAERIRDNMRELAKTGRWLGGMTPTGYASEPVRKVTIDGKTKKAFRLRELPEEAAVVRKIFEIFEEKQSLTSTEAELIGLGMNSKNGHAFSRYTIKGILQNPVYVQADEEIYDFFSRHGTEIYSAREAFDGLHGIMAYNRTDQSKGSSDRFNPIEEWIVSIGEHEGIVTSAQWLQVQKLLEQNKSKSFRRPTSQEALLSGILTCSCGAKMYPKVSKRVDREGGFQYTYVCNAKERSKQALCRMRNVKGNILDRAIIGELAKLECSESEFLLQIEKEKKAIALKERDQNFTPRLQEEIAKAEKKRTLLVDSLTEAEDRSVRTTILDRIEKLNAEIGQKREQIEAMKNAAEPEGLSQDGVVIICQMLSVFETTFDGLCLEQKRAAVRALIRKAVWDGESVRLIFFGGEENRSF